MPHNKHYEIIIAGAGAAGLSLADALLSQPELREKRILLADRRLRPVYDKTWCFWADHQIPYKSLHFHTWQTLEIRALGEVFSETLKNHQYCCLKSDDFAKNIFDRVSDCVNVTQLETPIDKFSCKNGVGVMHTPRGTFTAERIFQSVYNPPGYDRLKVDIALKQHFKGWIVRTKEDVFNPDKATFMDFEVPQKNGVTFVYVLPFSRNKALVEYTLFSEKLLENHDYDEGLERYMFDRYGLKPSQYGIEHTEAGIIPMEDRRFPATYCERVWNIGTVGGRTKPSTGYTLTRIFRHSNDIATALAIGREPPGIPASSYRFRVYDIMLMYQLKFHPERSISIFHELFRRNRFDAILQFLEEETHFGEELKIFASVPYLPFFESIWKMKHRIFTGA